MLLWPTGLGADSLGLLEILRGPDFEGRRMGGAYPQSVY